MKVYEGRIVTCDDRGTVSKYLVEDCGKIAFADCIAHLGEVDVDLPV